MITGTNLSNQVQSLEPFAPIQFETKREKIFNQSERSIEQFKSLENNTEQKPKYSHYSPEYSDGSWDAIIGADPDPYNWFASEDYRKGYLRGIEEKYDEKYVQFAKA